MSNFDSEIYLHLTKAENFESAFQIHQHFPLVSKRVVQEFWNEASKRFSLRLGEENKKWVVLEPVNSENDYSFFGIYFNDNFGVGYEGLSGQPTFGMWIEYSNKKLDRDKINEICKVEELPNFHPTNPYWLSNYKTQYNFKQFEYLVQALPENWDALVEETVNRLFDFSVKYEGLGKKLDGLPKKP